MDSAAISQLVSQSITPDMVVRRMLDLMAEPTTSPDDWLIDRIAAHKRRADRSLCACPYCSAIKVYVKAKLWLRYIQRDYDTWPSHYSRRHDRMLAEAQTRLTIATQAKDQAKLINISAYVGSGDLA